MSPLCGPGRHRLRWWCVVSWWVFAYLMAAIVLAAAGYWSADLTGTSVHKVRVAAILLGLLWPAVVVGLVIGLVRVVIAMCLKAVAK